jgi:Dolichyl-phosphate-mannose-protein mannosyltransferase
VSTIRYLLGALALYALLAVPMTYPQALHLTDTVHDDGDPLLNAWALAWVAHQLPLAPAHLFDANAFYPERRALAFSETMLVPAVAVAPLTWLGAGVLFTYNLVFLSGFVVSGAGVALLARSLTGSGAAGLVAGIVFAFLPYRIDHFPHVQLQQTQCLPFAFWAFHRFLRTNRLRDGVIFGAFTAGQVLSCMYYGLFLAPYMALVCGALLLPERLTKERLVPLAAAAAIALVAVAPVGIVYMEARKVVGERTTEEVANGSAVPRNYFGPPEANLLYGNLLKPFADGERRLFLGFVAMALGVYALFPSPRAKDAVRSDEPSLKRVLRDPRWAYALGLLFAFDLSLGFNGISYRVLYDYVLPYRGLRIPARTGIITGFSLAVLVGYGAARLARELRGHAEGQRRRSDDSAVRVSGVSHGRPDVHVLLDVSLAAPDQRLQRVLSAVVPAAPEHDAALSGSVVVQCDQGARRALPARARRAALRCALRAADLGTGEAPGSEVDLSSPRRRAERTSGDQSVQDLLR